MLRMVAVTMAISTELLCEEPADGLSGEENGENGELGRSLWMNHLTKIHGSAQQFGVALKILANCQH